MPLDKGALEVKPFLGGARQNGDHGPIFSQTFGLKAKPEDDLDRSIKQWRELQSELNAK